MVEESLSSKQVAHGQFFRCLNTVELLLFKICEFCMSTDLWMLIFLITLLISVYPTVVDVVLNDSLILLSLFSCDLTISYISC